jgi:ADP-ribose pyrophosphatase
MSRKVEIQACERVFDGYFKVDRYRIVHETFSGENISPITREVFERGHAACVLPYDPVLDHVVLIEQFRVGALAAGDGDPWLLETVAGIIDAGEAPEAVVRREAQEEAGLTVSDLEPLGTFLMSPGGTSESIALFAGRCDAARAGGIHGLPEEGEDIRVFTVPADEAIAMVHDNRIRNAMTAIALLRFDSKRAALREAWRGSN